MITAVHERRVSLPVALRLFVSGTVNQWSWFSFGMSMILFWVVIWHVDWSGVYYLGEVQRVQGRMLDSQATNLSINETPVVANSYRFVTLDGVAVEDFSYATGKWYPDGATVTVEYPVGRPHLSRIQGMRRQRLGPLGGLILAIMPLGAIIFMAFRIRKGYRHYALLKHGILAKSLLMEKTRTNVSVNDRPVYKLTFGFTAQDGKDYAVNVRTHETGSLEDDDEERLLYHPDNPANAAMVDKLLGQPSLNEHGSIQPQSVPLWPCFIPALTLLGHGGYLMITLVRAVV